MLCMGGMADDKSKVGSADRSRINVHEEYEVTYWSQKFRSHRSNCVKRCKGSGLCPQMLKLI